eukprot:CAMPEP_0202960706 /NCGR_PEP_ID=MMETSP1396-20130829/4861_1 /ASSEMBLY_ACC=CAM_ASM_000872 /TAXON_ID= /ORGANISM="Pseudokeronopsis sp., Strain Brazil" /LENGTH=135 /DNA_ID=CAMNT_0049680103 /DNA_START=973 /DNA_END=1380 /DNA_ORIENTATION=+
MTVTTTLFYVTQKFHYFFSILNSFYRYEADPGIQDLLDGELVASPKQELRKSYAHKGPTDPQDKINYVASKVNETKKNFSQWHYFYGIFCRPSNRFRITKNAVDRLYEEFSVEEYLTKTRMFDLYLDIQLLPYQK